MASQHNWHFHDSVIVPRDLSNIDLLGGRQENIIELWRDVCGIMKRSILADRLYSERSRVCVSDKTDDSVEPSSSDTVLELIATLRKADPTRRTEEKLLRATSFSSPALLLV